jgi:hypothetical protein
VRIRQARCATPDEGRGPGRPEEVDVDGENLAEPRLARIEVRHIDGFEREPPWEATRSAFRRRVRAIAVAERSIRSKLPQSSRSQTSEAATARSFVWPYALLGAS